MHWPTETFFIWVAVGVLSWSCLADIDADVEIPVQPIPEPSRELDLVDLQALLGTEEGRESLSREFQGIRGGQRRPWTVASLPENLDKNRYDDLLAYDETRVVLDPLPGDEHSDYINANYIDGQHDEREYVATQGPLPHTIDDFWRMIWQLNATKIVMLANIMEHGKMKVAQYWPETSSIYGCFQVTKLSEHTVSRVQHVVRTFSVKKSGVTVPRIVRQFHFTGWPDLGVPTERLPVVSIILQARQYRPKSKAPLVIHCSAGIGRTGTIILLDSMIQKGKAESVVDFPKRLDHLRVRRPDLVEKKEQYIFAHEAVNEFFNVPETLEILKEIDDEYRAMDKWMSVESLSPPPDLKAALERMKWHNTIMKLLIENLTEKSRKTAPHNDTNEII